MSRLTTEIEASGRTAIARRAPSAPFRRLLDAGLLFGDILDHGAGRGVDVQHGRQAGLNIAGWDPVHRGQFSSTPLTGRFDTILSTYVLNTLPPTGRRVAFRHMLSLLRPGGSLFVTVRRDCGPAHETSKGTFQDGTVDVAQLAHSTGRRAVTLFKTSTYETYHIAG